MYGGGGNASIAERAKWYCVARRFGVDLRLLTMEQAFLMAMEIVQLEVMSREKGSSAKVLRRKKIVPAVYYGAGSESLPLQMDYQTFRKVYIKVGTSQLVDLSIDGKKNEKVLVHEVQFHPLTGFIEHVDFLHVDMKKEIETDVPVEILGIAPAVKNLGGVLNTVKHELTVKCLPGNIPHSIEVDISGLDELHGAVHVSDLKVPEGVVITDAPEDVVVIINAPRVETEEAPVAAEGAEGEAAAGAEGEAKEGGEGDKAEGGEKAEKKE